MSAVPGPVYGLEVPPGEILIPAAMEFPASFRITMAAVDPTEEPEADEEGNVPAVPRSTLRIVKRAFPGLEDDEDDEIDEEYMKALLEGDDDESDDDEEEANGGPSDPAKSKKQKQAAAIKALLEATQGDEDEDEEMEDAKPNGVKSTKGKGKGKAKAVEEDEEEDDEEDDEDEDDSDDEEGGDLENFVICTLDTERNYQQPLDITVNHGEQVFFVVTGSHTVYLTGNYIMDDDEEEDSDEDDYDFDPEDMEYALGEDEDESDDLDDLEDPRVTEVESDEEAPKLVETKKGKNKRPAEDAESLDALIAKADDPKASKKQQKKLKNNKGEAVAAEDAKKDAKKVQFAKNLEQGPTGSTKQAGKAAGGVKVVQGVTIDDRTVGTGRTVKNGDTVGVRYIGKLANGQQFDANKKGKPFSFKVGKGQVIKGWDVGIAGMAIGGERRLTIPAHLAYGSKGMPGIPANSQLTFDVKLLEINYPPLDIAPSTSLEITGCPSLRVSPEHEIQADPNVLKLCHASSKVWSDIRGAIKAIGRKSHSSVSEASTIIDWGPVTSPALIERDQVDYSAALKRPEDPKSRGCTPREFARRLCFANLGLKSSPTVVVQNSSPKVKGSLKSFARSHSTPSSDASSGVSSKHSSKVSTQGNGSTTKTSLDSRSSKSIKSTMRRRANGRIPRTRSSPEGCALDTIVESGIDQVQPTILTVENAAAAKIYFETQFNNMIHMRSSRDTRQHYMESQLYFSPQLDTTQKNAIRSSFFQEETWHLREMRVLRSQSRSASMLGTEGPYVRRYESLKILGKGSFGVVRLVRERLVPQSRLPAQVFAMKVIRKSDMLRSSQEGHLRAERDFLVASEGSDWIVPLVASFQDASNLYLVMEYMPGGDFLGLLIRENVLDEAVARFYIAEMVLAVEEAHRLNCVHRDIKPDNFLISASGHLRLSDFGLAFDGHWSHDASYYNCHRYSLLRKLGINVNGDEVDQKEGRNIHTQLKWAQSLMSGLERHERRDASSEDDLYDLIEWRNRCSNRTAANSVVGTSQYMAPEVVLGQMYDGRCD
ncbi:FK506-binding protein [Paramyrothecium foliicola]|nr:FK506-binding protein [Paramyrothecium foliicola]